MRNIILSLLVLILAISIMGVDNNLFEISLKTASFKGMPGDSSYTEIYLSYARDDVTVTQADDGSHSGAIYISFSLLNMDGEIVDSMSIKRDIYIQSGINPKMPYHMIELYPFYLVPGEYRAVFIITDAANSSRQMSESINFTVDNYSTKDPKLSDIYLIGYVDMPDSSIFTRYNVKILPYPRAVFSPYFPMMKFTYELYNADDNRLFVGIEDGNEYMIRKFQEIDLPEDGVSFNEMNVAGLYEGEYDLIVKLANNKGIEVDESRFSFEVVKAKAMTKDSLSIEEKKLLVSMMHFLLNKDDERVFDALNDSKKFEFWTNYWARNDTTEDKSQKTDFINNWAYAAKTYESAIGKADGYLTDMGKIYIKYGAPDFIERHPFTSETNPWEKWIYTEGEINGEFIFGDPVNIGKMTLLSSTVLGEYQDENWEYRLNKHKQGD